MLSTLSFPMMMDTSSADLIQDFFIPALTQASSYDRGVGFFSSGWFKVASAGMIAFATNGGQARWVTSPILSDSDWEALQIGDEARRNPLLYSALEKNITELALALQDDVLSALAWMIADEVITCRLALPRNKLEQGNFHDKFGIFTDSAGNQVSFNGSYNDSIQGLRNYESIKIFCSWHNSFAPLVKMDADRFERLWTNTDPNVQIFDLPEAAKEKILKLRTQDRPYPEPEWVKGKRIQNESVLIRPQIPASLQLRDYQEEAISAWFENKCRGFLEMATGTGKTITSLAAAARLYAQEQRLAVVIAVPYQHLVDQWADESRRFGFRPVLVYKSKKQWINEVNQQIFDFTAGYRNFVSFITTHDTLISSTFQACLEKLSGPVLFLADEAHHLGAERSRTAYPQQVPYRLALSATPDRWFDDFGTETLREYFGPTVFSFSLEQAIGVSLTPYRYFPKLVQLTDEELDQYDDLSARIARLIHRQPDADQDKLKFLLIQRAKLLNNAANKLPALSHLVDQSTYIEHALFYCSPEQIDDVVRLLGWEKGLLVHRFTAEENTAERQQLLSRFADGNLQALAAMKCLDEGVDVPSTQTAYFLASSSNPREFIQRRGRILRKYPGKEVSVIHDLIAVPPNTWESARNSPTFEVERKIMRRELTRFKEFASPAINKHQALDVIWDIAGCYGLMDF